MQSLETLAVIAYKQPVTAPEIAEIRGVSSSSGVLQTLIERKLIKTVGRKQVVGRPFMYGTTREFLDRFGLNDITDLPKVEELSDALGFELPPGLAEPTVTTSPLPFDIGRRAAAARTGAGRRRRDDRPLKLHAPTAFLTKATRHEDTKDLCVLVTFVREPWAPGRPTPSCPRAVGGSRTTARQKPLRQKNGQILA